MLSIVGRHIDALYLSLSFEFPEALKATFAAAKLDAQESGDDMRELIGHIPGCPGGAWYIRPYGNRKSQYVLENAAMWVAFSTWANMPACTIQFKAATLYEYEPEDYSRIVETFIRFWIGPKLIYKEKVSRLDLAVDFQEDDFKLPMMGDVLCRARDRVVHYRGDTANAITLGKYGQSLQSQIYCKSEELLKGDKQWMFEVWRASGQYREDLPVWRTEIRFFRQGLRAFDCHTLDDVLASLGDLAAYVVGDSSGVWFRVVEDDMSRDDHHNERRESAGWWKEVAAAFCEALALNGRKRKGYIPKHSFGRAVELAGAHMARAAAIARASGWNLGLTAEGFGKNCGKYYADVLKQRQERWSDRVNLKIADLRGEVWITKPPDVPPVFTWY
jgi:hypothetical protein